LTSGTSVEGRLYASSIYVLMTVEPHDSLVDLTRIDVLLKIMDLLLKDGTELQECVAK